MGKSKSYFAAGKQRIYQAEPQRFWVNSSERDTSGAIIRDRRHEIKLEDLLGQN